MRLFHAITYFGIFMTLFLCHNDQDYKSKTYILKVQDICQDTLRLGLNNSGVFYKCSAGDTYDLKFKFAKDQLVTIVYDFEFQHKPSQKIPIAEFTFENNERELILNSVKYLHSHYIGEFRFLEDNLKRLKFIKL